MPDQRTVRYALWRRWSAAFALLGLCLVTTHYLVQAAGFVQDPAVGEKVFTQKCASCHTIGAGVLVGPDLEGVTARRDPEWLRQFILAPEGIIGSGDPTALQLLDEYNNVAMPNMGLSEQDAADVIAFLSGPPSASANPPPAGVPAGDADFGEKIFTGAVGLEQGGTACIACHSVEGAGFLGGGSLGPDLTHVATRYGSKASLGSVLQTLPFPSMQGIFSTRPLTESEQAGLVAFFTRADAQGEPPVAQRIWLLVGAGAVIPVVLFIGMFFFGPAQRTSPYKRLRSSGKQPS